MLDTDTKRRIDTARDILDQPDRLQLEFQGVFAPLLTVFAFAHFVISNV